MSNIYASPTKNYITRNGFVMVSNLLLQDQQKLGITEGEMMFIIRILKNRTSAVIHDEELDPSVSTRTLARRRSSLKEKGYLKYSIVKKQDESGVFRTEGIMYDLTPLEEKLQAISDKLEEQKVEKLKNELKEKIIVEETDDYLSKYKNDYKEYYGVDYNISDYEQNYYDNLSEEDKKAVSHIFEYCESNNLLETIVPRLSLFFKTKFRFIELRKYCNSLINVKEVDLVNEENEILIKEFKKEYNCSEKDYALIKVIERTCYRTTDRILIKKIIDKFLEGR